MTKDKSSAASVCGNDQQTDSPAEAYSCKLTTQAFRLRKETVLAPLKQQVLDKKTLPDGYAFQFPGTDRMLDALTAFIKTERTCCGFFTFRLSVSGGQKEIWLEITGDEGIKTFITTELGL